MNPTDGKSILVLDDDDNFRTFVVSLLESRGVDVIEAKSAREATIKLGSTNPMLAIVDYRLPESDGITWITKLRDQGKNFPIVFLSGTWCNEKTFDWLRNILRVSLILQKPLVADLFLQQIESLLPKGTLKPESEDDYSAINMRPQESLDEKTDSIIDQQLPSAEKKADLKDRLAELRKNYAGELSQSWQDLTDSIRRLQQDQDNAVEKNQAAHIAHKIRGTAGSIGYAHVGEIAGKLEDLIRGLDPRDTLNMVVWSEIELALPSGADLVKTIVNTSEGGETASSQQAQVPQNKLLLVGNRINYSQYLGDLSATFSLEIDVADSVIGARNKLKNQSKPYDAAILDLDWIGTKENLFDLAKDIRLAQGHKCVPLSIVLPPDHKLKPEDIAYIGASAVIDKNLLDEQLKPAVDNMFSSLQGTKPRVLLVDDDEVLTKFLTDLLLSAGMIVESLHKPIKIIATAESFNPDLVLLDVEMPGLSGYDVCRILRATDKWKQLPILFLTSKSDQVSRAAAFKAGGSDFLCKPVLEEEVLARVTMHLQNSAITRQPQRDQLTNTLNTNEFVNQANDVLKAAGEQGQTITMCLLTVDNFSKLTIQHGWFATQTILTTLGQLLNGRFKACDLRAHIAEDTFALLFVNENIDTTENVMAMLRNEFADIKFPSDSVGHFKTIFNVGIAEFPNDGTNLRSLLDSANQRLLGGKLSTSR